MSDAEKKNTSLLFGKHVRVKKQERLKKTFQVLQLQLCQSSVKIQNEMRRCRAYAQGTGAKILSFDICELPRRSSFASLRFSWFKKRHAMLFFYYKMIFD